MAAINNPTLVLANLVAAYLSAKSMTPPNPPPAKHDKSDSILHIPAIARSPKFGALQFLFLNLTQTYLVARGATSNPLKMFPHPEHVNPKFLTWSRYSATCLGLISVSGVVRLAAYRALGDNFTFELARPSGLKTDGIYKYVQHPSYLPLLVIMVTNAAYFGAPDGVLGAWLGRGLAKTLKSWEKVGFAAWTALWCAMVFVRVRDEEGMLRKEFGEEWEVWHRKTARFVPWIF